MIPLTRTIAKALHLQDIPKAERSDKSQATNSLDRFIGLKTFKFNRAGIRQTSKYAANRYSPSEYNGAISFLGRSAP